MTRETPPSCKVFRPAQGYEGKQGFSYLAGISAESAGARGICMHLLTIPPGQRGRAHMHENHETAIYVIGGESEMWYGQRLEHHMTVGAGEMLYIPAGMPHLPANPSRQPVTAVIARTDPHEQESVVLLPELDALVPR
ncbi:MAG TPA: cupin domain-containing protein [Thermohalobaculum sp.]|nr:cupin domain-containing protein [Thermohalobaculum sp.]